MLEILSYGFMQNAFIGGIAIALASGIIGPFLVLRRLSLLGDGLAHLAFGGVALGLLLGVDPFYATIVFVVIGGLFVHYLLKKNIYGDAAIALILSFGVGLAVTIIGITNGFNVNLFSYLIGSVLALSSTDIIIVLSLLVVVAGFVALFYKKLMFITFNDELAKLRVKNVEIINIIFTVLVALVVVMSIRAVGILLVSALIVIPTLIALQLSGSFRSTLVFSSLSSVIAVLFGIILSYYFNIPPSGAIVMTLFAFFIVAASAKKFIRFSGV